MKNKGACLGCKHFHMEPGYQYLEITYEDFSAGCSKNVYPLLTGEYADVWYKKIFVEGATCGKYVQAAHVK